MHRHVRNRELVQLLIDNGANVKAKDNNGFTPLHEVAFVGGEAEEEEMEDVVATAQLLIDKDANVNDKDEQGQTPLHKAVVTRFDQLIKLLIERDAYVNAQDNEGDTPLHLVVQELKDDPEGLTEAQLKEVIEELTGLAALLINKGADPFIKNNEGKTALGLAEEKGHKEIVEEPLQARAKQLVESMIGENVSLKALAKLISEYETGIPAKK